MAVLTKQTALFAGEWFTLWIVLFTFRTTPARTLEGVRRILGGEAALWIASVSRSVGFVSMYSLWLIQFLVAICEAVYYPLSPKMQQLIGFCFCIMYGILSYVL